MRASALQRGVAARHLAAMTIDRTHADFHINPYPATSTRRVAVCGEADIRHHFSAAMQLRWERALLVPLQRLTGVAACARVGTDSLI